MPLTHLAATYMAAGFQPSDESVRRVQEAGEAALTGWVASRAPELCRLALGMPLRAATAEWFLKPFQEADRAFTGLGDVHRASVYGAGLAAEVLARRNGDTVQLAFGLLAGSLANRIPSPAAPDLVDAAQRHLGAVQMAWRARPKIALPKLPALDTCSGLHLSAVGRDLIGLNRLTLAGIIGCVWLTFGDPRRTIGATGLHLSALAHACWD